MGFICLPCQVGGREYKGYGETPFAGKETTRKDVREMLLVQNDYEHAKNKAGQNLPAFIPFKELTEGNVHQIYEEAIPLETFIQTNISKGNILLMNFQLQNKKDARKRFYIAQFPFENFTGKQFQVQGVTGVCGGLTWTGIKPCQVKVNFDANTVDFESPALTMQNVPMLAIWVMPDKGPDKNVALKL